VLHKVFHWSNGAISTSKKFRGWGMKNIYIFSKTLVAKKLWRLVYNEALWGKVMKLKYVEGRNMENWF
jgi:hypothetical protein